MTSFLTIEQRELAQEVGSLLADRGQTIAVAEATAGGLISAALLSVPGASRYYAGGAVVYTRNSRIMLAGVPPEEMANYRGTTAEMIVGLADSMRQRLGATWCVAESGVAGPTGSRPGRTVIGIAGPVSRTETFETGLVEREANMMEFTTRSLRSLRDALREAEP
jgi:PncC family amidohydrolase